VSWIKVFYFIILPIGTTLESTRSKEAQKKEIYENEGGKSLNLYLLLASLEFFLIGPQAIIQVSPANFGIFLTFLCLMSC